MTSPPTAMTYPELCLWSEGAGVPVPSSVMFILSRVRPRFRGEHTRKLLFVSLSSCALPGHHSFMNNLRATYLVALLCSAAATSVTAQGFADPNRAAKLAAVYPQIDQAFRA